MHYLQCTSQTIFVQIYFEEYDIMQLFSVILRLIAKVNGRRLLIQFLIILITKLLNIKTYTVNANILGVASQLTLTNPFGVLSPIILPILSTTHFFEVIEAIHCLVQMMYKHRGVNNQYHYWFHVCAAKELISCTSIPL